MPKILTIDDNEDNLIVLRALLKNIFPKAEIIEAQSGRDGIDLAYSAQPDVILLDLIMPVMDGYEVCRTLKNDHRVSHIPIVILTAIIADKKNRIKALEFGADAFLTKPVDEAELIAQVKAMLRIKESEDLKRSERDRLAELVEERTQKLEIELAEHKKTESELRGVLEKLEENRKATLNLMEDLKEEIETRRKTEEAIRESEEKFSKTFRSSPIAMVLTNLNTGAISDVNEAMLSLTGFDYDELIGKPALSLKMWESPEDRQTVINDIRNGIKVFSREYQFCKKSSESYTALYSAELVTINRQDYLLSNLIDITRQKKIEQELKNNQERLLCLKRISEYNYTSLNDLQFYALEEALNLTNSKSGHIFSYDEDKGLFELTTRSKNTPLEGGTTPRQAVFKLEESGLFGVVVKQRKEIVINDWPARASEISGLPEGHQRLIRLIILPVFDEHKIAAVISVSNKETEYDDTDVLQLKLLMNSVWKIIQRNQIIEKNLMLLRAIESSSNSIIITNANGEIEYTNPCFSETTGYELEEVIGKNPRILKSGQTSDAAYKQMWEAINSGHEWRGEFRNKKKDGTLFWELATISPVRDLNGEIAHYIAVKEDITERKKMEEALTRSEMEFRKIWESSLDGMRLTDSEGIILKVNEAFCKMVNLTREELEGQPLTIIYSSEQNAIESYKKRFRERSIKPLIEAQITLREKTVWVEVAASILSLNDNELVVLSIFRDITLRKQAELEIITAKERAEEMNRLKSSFLNNMSHELRTPLIGILGFSEIFLESLTDPDQREMADCILKGGKRLYDTLNLILNISKLEAGKYPMTLKAMDLGEAAKEHVKLYEAVARQKNISLTTVISDENPICSLDDKMLEQIIGNLVNNAIKFTDNGGVTVEVTSETSGNPAKPEKYCVLRVHDTGIGIRPDDFDLIFDEFRQVSEGLSRGFEGTGLGLSITKKFVEKLGGTISVQSTVNKGTVFTVKFPSIENIKSPNNSLTGANDSAILNEIPEFGPVLPSILLVDDDENTCRLTKRFLEGIYEVDTATKANAAIEKARVNRYSLILMDINLGYGMNGIAAKNEIKKIPGYESTPVIAFTAYAMPDEQQELLRAGFDNYFSKPFIKSDLLAMISYHLRA